jgi:dolichyl-phosphate-mannose-protein mannosyltransferase
VTVRHRFVAALVLLALLALGLRVLGLPWGLPEAGRYYPYHPDEPDLVVAVLNINFGALQLSPRFFNYGSLYLYFCRLGIDAAGALGRLNLMPPRIDASNRIDLTRWWRDFALIFLVGRWITVVMGVAAVCVTGAFAARAFGPAAGLIAAAALALAPLHALHSHFMTVDVPATLWVAVALCVSLRVLETPTRGWFAAAGAASGLAAGTKYNAGLVLLSVLAALVIAARRVEGRARRDIIGEGLLYALLAAGGAFLLATPGILIDSQTFWHDFNYERSHMAQGHGYLFVGTPPGWWFHIPNSLAPGLGWPLLLAAGVAIAWALRCREPADWLLLAFAVPYYLLIGAFQVKFARYTLPLFPPLCIWIGRAVADGTGWRDRQPRASFALAVRAVALLVGLYTLLYSLAIDGVMMRPDNRTAAAAWLQEHAAADTPVALASPPWFYTAPVTPSIGLTKVLARLAPLVPERAAYPLLIPSREALTPDELATRRPRYVEVSEFEDRDALRVAEHTGRPNPIVALQQALDRDYRVATRFEARPSLGPLAWFTRRPPPHDMLYPMPYVLIYERRAPG